MAEEGDSTTTMEKVTQDMDDLSFDPTMKKKKSSSSKKKTVAFDDPTTADVATEQGEDGDDFLAGMKKKKKSSLKKPSGDAAAEEGTAADGDAEDGGDLDFSSLKKKKKKRVIENQVAELEARLEEAGVVADKEAEGAEGEDLFAKSGEEVEEVSPEDEEAAWLKSDRDYTYEELLHRIFRILRENNPSLGLGKKVTLPPPLVFREGSKRTIFANINDMAIRLHRPLDHFKDYLFAELGTNGSVDASNRLILKGRFQQKQLENVVRRYIHEYVTCKTCKSPETLLGKENRVWFISCENCGSKRSVSAIKTGFQAQTAKRRTQRAAN